MILGLKRRLGGLRYRRFRITVAEVGETSGSEVGREILPTAG